MTEFVTIGHNNPPSPIEQAPAAPARVTAIMTATKGVDDLVAQYAKWENVTLTTDDQAAVLLDLDNRLKDEQESLTTKYAALKKPFEDAPNRLKVWASQINRVGEIRRQLKAKRDTYIRARDRLLAERRRAATEAKRIADEEKQAAEARRIAAEQEAIRVASEIAQQPTATAETIEIVNAAMATATAARSEAAAAEDAAAAAQNALRAIPERAQIRPALGGRAVSVRRPYIATIEDIDAVLNHLRDNVQLRDKAQQIVSAMVRNGARQIPGCRIEQEPI